MVNKGLSNKPPSSTEENWLQGKTVLITGATSGIGRSIALAVHAKGAIVIAHSRTAESVQAVLPDQDRVKRVVGDLQNKAGWIAVESAIEAYNPDVLILNAGYNFGKKLVSELSDQNIVDMINVNLTAPIRSARTFARLAKTGEDRRLVLVLSTSCFYPREHMSLYIAAKTGLMGFGKVLQQEMHELGIRTFLLYPGRTNTHIREDEHPEYINPDSVAQAVIAMLCLPNDLVPYEFVFRPVVDTRI